MGVLQSEQGSPAAATSARMAPTGTPPVQQENPTSTAEMISEQASNPVRAASGSSPALPSTDPPAEARRPPVGSDANKGPDRSASAVVSSRKDTPTEARSPLPASDSGAQQTSGVSSPSSFSSPAPEMAEIPTATAQQAARANPGGGGDSNAKGGVLDASVSTPQRSTGSDPRYTGAGPGGVDGENLCMAGFCGVGGSSTVCRSVSMRLDVESLATPGVSQDGFVV